MPDSRPEARRTFLKAVAGGIGGALAALAAVPSLVFLGHGLRHDPQAGSDQLVRVAAPADVQGGRPLRVGVTADVRDGWSRLTSVKVGAAWLVRGPGEQIRAFSTVCPHLGCGVDWNAKAQIFECPWDGSTFDVNGNRLDGPARRGLDELEVIATDEDIRVRYQHFRLGTNRKEPVQ